MSTRIKHWFLAILAISLLSSCLGSDSNVAGGGTGGTGISWGTVTGFGSIFVTGVEHNTANATNVVDGVSGTGQTGIKLGMVARVTGSISGASGAAGTIVVEDTIEGQVESRDDTARTITILGQTVQTDAATIFDNSVPAFASINPGDTLEIHGLIQGPGKVLATFIERKAGLPSPFEVHGIVSGHDAAARTLQIGALTVNYNTALTNDMPAGSWNGLLVEVKGSACAGNPVCGTLTATKVEPDGLAGDAAQAELEGFVTAIVSQNPLVFLLGTQRVETGAATVFKGGVASEIVLGSKVEAEGTLAGGVLRATKVDIKESARVRGNVATLNPDGTFTLTGLGGITVETGGQTAFKPPLTGFADLALSNHVELRGRVAAGNRIIATELERRNVAADNRVELRGPVTLAIDPHVTILGVTANLALGVLFKDINDAPIARAAFFAALPPASTTTTVVKLRGDLSGALPVWTEAELED